MEAYYGSFLIAGAIFIHRSVLEKDSGQARRDSLVGTATMLIGLIAPVVLLLF